MKKLSTICSNTTMLITELQTALQLVSTQDVDKDALLRSEATKLFTVAMSLQPSLVKLGDLLERMELAEK
jgi:hypothetical protein